MLRRSRFVPRCRVVLVVDVEDAAVAVHSSFPDCEYTVESHLQSSKMDEISQKTIFNNSIIDSLEKELRNLTYRVGAPRLAAN